MTLFTKKKAGAALGALAAVGLVLATPGIASAEPSGTPTYRALVAAGSDTIQDVANGLSDVAIRNISGTPTKIFGSYNATVPSGPNQGLFYDNITTKSGGPSFSRPNGSSDGLKALRASEEPATYPWQRTLNFPAQPPSTTFASQNIGGQVDIARSSSGHQGTTPSDLAYIPIGQDAVGWAKHSSATSLPANIDLGASVGETWTSGANNGRLKLTLRNIYLVETTADDSVDGGDATTSTLFATSSSAGVKVGEEASGAAIVPFVPQVNSGTRNFWSTVLGGSGGNFALHVKDIFGGLNVQEHDGSILDVPALRNKAIVPFSVAQWVSQTNGVAPDRLEGAVLGQVNGVSATTGSGTSYAQNASFPSALKRLVYFVAKTARLTSVGVAADAQLQRFLRGQANLGAASNVVNPASAVTEWIGNHNSTIAQYGFSTLPTSGTGDVIGKIVGYRAYTSF